MKDKKKSAKDIAFDKERAVFRKQIRELEIRELRNLISQKETEMAEKDDWIRRLLDYTELSEDDLKKFIENEKIKAHIYDGFGLIDKMFFKMFQF